MRRSTRTSLIALLFAILAFAATGCGGSEVAADEVPGPPPTLSVPTDSDVGGNSNAAADTSAKSDGKSTTSSDSGTADSGAASADSGTATPPADTSGGTAAPEATAAPDTAASDTPPAAGSPPQQFEDFCQQNAGAC
jgi:hypothetical protein